MKLLLGLLAFPLLLTAGALAESTGKNDGKNDGKKKGREKGMRNTEFAAQFMKRLDQNSDGAVSKEEFEANPRLERASSKQREKLFKRLDKNKDGLISPEEVKPAQRTGRGGPAAWLKEGPVTFEQFSQKPRVQRLNEEMRRRLFDRMDQNGDGVLSKDDHPRGKQQRPGQEGQTRGAKLVDSDGDGSVSFAEFQAAPFHRHLDEDEAEDRFEALDTNSDGLLDEKEREAFTPRKPQRQRKGDPSGRKSEKRQEK